MTGKNGLTALWSGARGARRPDAARPISRTSQMALGVGILAVLCGGLTYAILTGLTPYTPDRAGLTGLLLANLTLGLTLLALIAWRVVRLWAERKSGRAGARLHVRLVAWFSIIAVVPAILVAVFAAMTLNLGLEAWFSARVKDALGNAVNVAQVYVKEHERGIIGDAYEIANNIQRDQALFDSEQHVIPSAFFSKVDSLTRDRGLQASYVLDSTGHVLISTKQKFLKDPPPPSPADLTQARKGSIVVDAVPASGTVTALIQMTALKDAYLLVVRVVDPKVFGYYTRTQGAVSEYNRLNENRLEAQLLFAALYAVVSLVVLLAAVWSGIWAANRLVQPISNLIAAAESVSAGDLDVQVDADRQDDEIGTLGVAFNRMTLQLSAQRGELVAANRLIDQRRRFTETVLSGVSAGVIGLDLDGRVTLVNRAAARLLGASQDELEGTFYRDSLPELAALIGRAMSEPVGHAGGEVSIQRGGKPRALSVQVSGGETGDEGFVVTFDDITDLVSAQRTAAWADVARRIAHEIKNPLTPIQLSAERLKRKYAGEIASDPEIFQQCTDTIIRQVGDIGRMVDEFSSFARMPTPVMKRENAQELLQQAVFLQRVAHPDIAFTTSAPKEAVHFEGDGRLVAQALTNVLKNAGEGVAARLAKGDSLPGAIHVAIEKGATGFSYRIRDNGVGLPPEHRHRLTEPYVTTRAKGTGLGLAIVRKIMEDHGGAITLADAEDGQGAQVTLTLPYTQKKISQKGPEDEQERIADRV